MNAVGTIILFFRFASFSLLGGSSLAIYSGLLVEIFYPQIFTEFWGGWWVIWVTYASLLYFIRNKGTNLLFKSISASEVGKKKMSPNMTWIPLKKSKIMLTGFKIFKFYPMVPGGLRFGLKTEHTCKYVSSPTGGRPNRNPPGTIGQ